MVTGIRLGFMAPAQAAFGPPEVGLPLGPSRRGVVLFDRMRLPSGGPSSALFRPRFTATPVAVAVAAIQIPYEVVKPESSPKAVVIYARGAPDKRSLAEHVLGKNLVERGYAVYSYRVQKTPDWQSYDGGESHARDLEQIVDLVRRQNPTAQIHLIGSSMGAVPVRRYLEDHAGEIASAIFEVPAFENHAAVFHSRRAEGKFVPYTLFPRTGREISTPSFWLLADKDVMVSNGRAKRDRAQYFTGYNEELTLLDFDHFPYRGGNARFALAIADWLDRREAKGSGRDNGPAAEAPAPAAAGRALTEPNLYGSMELRDTDYVNLGLQNPRHEWNLEEVFPQFKEAPDKVRAR